MHETLNQINYSLANRNKFGKCFAAFSSRFQCVNLFVATIFSRRIQLASSSAIPKHLVKMSVQQLNSILRFEFVFELKHFM